MQINDPGQGLPAGEQETGPQPSYSIKLEVLRALGKSALSNLGKKFDWLRVVEVEITYEGEFQEVDVKKATDIFAAAEASGRPPIPDGGTITRVTFLVKFPRHPDPVLIDLFRDGTISSRDNKSVLWFEQWLLTSAFNTVPLAHAAMFFLLACLTAATPVINNSDADDTDDLNSDRHHTLVQTHPQPSKPSDNFIILAE